MPTTMTMVVVMAAEMERWQDDTVSFGICPPSRQSRQSRQPRQPKKSTINKDIEYEKELQFVCSTYNLQKTDWYAIAEAEYIVNDKIRIAAGLKPIYSNTLSEKITITIEDTSSEESDNEIPLIKI